MEYFFELCHTLFSNDIPLAGLSGSTNEGKPLAGERSVREGGFQPSTARLKAWDLISSRTFRRLEVTEKGTWRSVK